MSNFTLKYVSQCLINNEVSAGPDNGLAPTGQQVIIQNL